MEPVKVELVHLSSEEIQEKKKSGQKVLELSEEFKKVIYDTFYGGYNGTPTMGQGPNVIILTE